MQSPCRGRSAKFGLDVMTDNATHTQEKTSYSHNEAFWGEQDGYQAGAKNDSKDQGKETGRDWVGVLWWLRGGARVRAPEPGQGFDGLKLPSSSRKGAPGLSSSACLDVGKRVRERS